LFHTCQIGCLAIILLSAVTGYSQTSVSGQSHVLETTICDALAHPSDFAGKLVKVHAKYSGTWEGAWLRDEKCPSRIGEIGNAKKEERNADWEKFESAARKLYTGMDYVDQNGKWQGGRYDYITADFLGTLIIRRDFRVKNGFGNGWGHLRMSRFRLLLHSVSNVSPHPCACPPEDDEAPPEIPKTDSIPLVPKF
jgi:hypothetical protein